MRHLTLVHQNKYKPFLYEKNGAADTSKKHQKGQPSTAESVLQELAENYKLPQLILDYRSMRKLCSTYADKLPQMVNSKTGRIHTSYHQAVTATGRLSSSNPNLQKYTDTYTRGQKN